ncbi:uncharacterized protein LOC122016211 [Zingiber officinale]|uniref:Sphingomyelin phosphodiesterase 4 n=1 Tax=Zingiber officinale TaxID=94328 RepID=A0A8J5FD01_ZINOF|nr:uncharacterized protein LOC122016211 [Zingiber officinale]KAG6483953.1 hypothetical protein ZIOFF_060746 [Zingiber officinale]
MDSQNRAQDIAASILSASAPPQIDAACSAVDAFLRRHASDQSRAFFSIAFPSLICRLFGFDDVPPPSSVAAAQPTRPASTAWIDQAAADLTLSRHLFSLLSPDGVLFSSIAAIDQQKLVRYVFPLERLPEWIRFVLQTDRPCSEICDLCPLLSGRVKEDPVHGSPYHIELNAFEYYLFWFAYYPVCRGNSENSSPDVIQKSRTFRLENWTSSLSVLSGATRRPGQKSGGNLYLQLLYAYLRAFVPKDQPDSSQPYRSSLLHYSFSHDDTTFLQAEFMVDTFAHFWMLDNDFSPLQLKFCRSFGLTFPFRALLRGTPPTPGLGDSLKLIVKYLNYNPTDAGGGNENSASGESPILKRSQNVVNSKNMMLYCKNSVVSWNEMIQRPLYRFILRSFLFGPIGSFIKNASQVFYLWMAYLEPWKISPDDFSEFEFGERKDLENKGKENMDKKTSGKDANCMELHYSPGFESYVLSNYLFYSSLVVHFLGFAHKFLHTNPDSVIQMVLKVLDIMTASKLLLDLLQKVSVAYHSKPVGAAVYSSNDMQKYVSSIHEQLQDWEDGLYETEADGSFLHENWNHELKLFSDSEDGAHNLLQLFMLRAEHEIQMSSGDVSSNMQALDAIRSKMFVLFGISARKSASLTLTTSQTHDIHHARNELFTPKHPGVGERSWSNLKYKGDWMRRPISDTEVAWLANLLIRFSNWLNELLGLNHVDEGNLTSTTSPTIVHLSSNEVRNLEGPKEAITMLLELVGSLFSLFGNVIVKFLRSHKMRINLRVLASKKFAMLLLLYFIFCLLKKLFSAVFVANP